MTQVEEKRAELVEHLAELRTRLLRTMIYICVGTAAAWFLYDWILALLTHPMQVVNAKISTKFLMTHYAEPFMIRMQITLVAGIVFVSPAVVMELWGFVAPGLTRQERRPIRWIAPLSAVLFLSGVLLGYAILPTTFAWFAKYIPAGAELRPDMQANILWTLKFLVAFGLVFELPIVLMLLGKVGIVNSRMLWANWKYAMVGCVIVAAVATPSGDAFTMMVMAIPVTILYFLSIGLVRVTEPKAYKR